MQGGDRLKGRAALAEIPLGRGRVVLFGFRPQYRAQSWATIPALLNAIYTSAAREGQPSAKRKNASTPPESVPTRAP